MLPGLMMPPGLMAGGGGSKEITFKSSTNLTGSTNSITIPAGVTAGDILVMFRFTTSGLGSAPDAPSGWTLANSGANINWSGGDLDMRISICYKLAVGNEGGTGVATANGNSQAGTILMVFGVGAASLSHGSAGVSATNAAPSNLTVTAGVAPQLVVAAYSASGAISPRGFSPAKGGEVQAGSHNKWAAYSIFNGAPSDVTISMADHGNGNNIVGLRINAS